MVMVKSCHFHSSQDREPSLCRCISDQMLRASESSIIFGICFTSETPTRAYLYSSGLSPVDSFETQEQNPAQPRLARRVTCGIPKQWYTGTRRRNRRPAFPPAHSHQHWVRYLASKSRGDVKKRRVRNFKIAFVNSIRVSRWRTVSRAATSSFDTVSSEAPDHVEAAHLLSSKPR